MTASLPTDFDEWLVTTFAEAGPFTLLFVLVHIGETRIDLLRSAYLHVMGDETRWPAMAALFDGAGVAWTGAALFRAGREGLVADAIARGRLAALVGKLNEDRLLIREGEFFNDNGLRLSLEAMKPH
ncbi:hypothetical protein P7D22_10120 [Lichenihabitans sp. Uapishka_5]|uniref:hypothetical protein n=1 Tax=Lichenihabitans sp. Uapishka_5 TaxID=3037302 RepID=UPI0029E7DBC6|nr:hypothetical protein [Lichenihabitans sp. Uapishka_5]MDX7951522.1 hypothetical protein [Lichenihabitans sp. Uapishka_5]